MGKPTPITNKVPNIVVAFLTVINILNNNKKYTNTISMAPTRPYSSTIIA